jgi:hypothetical protein
MAESSIGTAATTEQALRLLQTENAPWFAGRSDDFLQGLASLMSPVHANDGHVFVEGASCSYVCV